MPAGSEMVCVCHRPSISIRYANASGDPPLGSVPCFGISCSRYLKALCCRLVWNRALPLQKERLDSGEGCLAYGGLAALLPAWKVEFPFLTKGAIAAAAAGADALGPGAAGRLRQEKPKALSRLQEKVRLRRLLPLLPEPHGRGGWRHWFVAVQTEAEIPAPVHPSRSMAGGDLSVVRFLTLSDGTVYRPLNFFAKLARRLPREQRRLARRVKGSRNWLKQKAGITGLHIRIADARSDYLHKVSSAVSKNHAVVVLEELRVANMSASARGTLLAPGCRVRQKAGLNRAILDQGWGEFARQLEYQQSSLGGLVLSTSMRRAPAKSARATGTAPRGT